MLTAFSQGELVERARDAGAIWWTTPGAIAAHMQEHHPYGHA